MRKPINDDDLDPNQLKDGESLHIPMRFCDALSRDVAKHFSKPARQHLTDGHGNTGVALNRPGFRALSGGNARTQAAWDSITRATEAAYAADSHYKETAWKDAILDEDDENAVYAAQTEAKGTDAYVEHENWLKDEWRRGNE